MKFGGNYKDIFSTLLLCTLVCLIFKFIKIFIFLRADTFSQWTHSGCETIDVFWFSLNYARIYTKIQCFIKILLLDFSHWSERSERESSAVLILFLESFPKWHQKPADSECCTNARNCELNNCTAHLLVIYICELLNFKNR